MWGMNGRSRIDDGGWTTLTSAENGILPTPSCVVSDEPDTKWRDGEEATGVGIWWWGKRRADEEE